jgi:hypothetical protein
LIQDRIIAHVIVAIQDKRRVIVVPPLAQVETQNGRFMWQGMLCLEQFAAGVAFVLIEQVPVRRVM